MHQFDLKKYIHRRPDLHCLMQKPFSVPDQQFLSVVAYGGWLVTKMESNAISKSYIPLYSFALVLIAPVVIHNL
jgi:hypothetical protein